MTKRAVVLAGGGSRGAYQIGVWQAMRELGIDFDIVTGTSVGALNGAMMVQGDYEFAYKMWEEISTDRVLDVEIDEKLQDQKAFARTFNTFAAEMLGKGGVDSKPLEDMLRERVDEEKIRNSDIDFAIVTVEYPSFEPCIVNSKSFEDGKLVDYLMASASCFPAMRMKDIDGKKYIDGGYYDNMPIELALQMGADEIIAVDLDGIGRNRAYNADGKKITHITSYWNLGMILLFEGEIAKQNIKLGYLDGLKFLGGFEGMAYTFYKGESEKLEEAGRGTFKALIEAEKNIREPRYMSAGLTAIAKNAVLKAIAKKKRRSSLKISNILSAAEISAELFAVSPLKVYTADEFRTAIIKAYERRKDEIPDMEDMKNLPEAVDNLSKALSPESRAVFCAEKLEEYLDGKSELSILTGIAAVMPQEFLAAVYLVSIKRLQDYEK